MWTWELGEGPNFHFQWYMGRGALGDLWSGGN